MQYTQIRGLPISKITLGTVALGKEYGISNADGKPTESQAAKVLSTALAAGINTLDTANDYGNAEQLIGNFAELHSADKETVLVTKFKIRKESLSDKKKARQEAFQSVASSLKWLRLKKIPVCLYHKEADVSTAQLMEVLPSLMSDLQDEGLIGIAGVSVYNPREVLEFSTNDIFQAFQIPMNVFDHRLLDLGLLHDLQAKEKIIFIRSVFLQGLFFMPPDSLKGNLVAAKSFLKGLAEIAETEGMSIAELAFSFVRDVPGVTSIVFGAVNEQQVLENARLLSSRTLSKVARNAISSLVANIPEQIITPGKW